MLIPTEPIGSVPRPAELIAGMRDAAEGRISDKELEALSEHALEQTIAELEATGSPVITDGEQLKPSFVTYPIQNDRRLRVRPLADDTSTARATAFAKIRARVDGTQLAAAQLG